MKKQIIILALCAAATLTQAVNIPIPSGNFGGAAGSVPPPYLLGTTTGNIGQWSAQMTGILNLGGGILCGTAAAVGGPTTIGGTNELAVDLPASVLVSGGIWQTLTNRWQPNSVYNLSVYLDQGTVADLIGSSTLSLKAGNTVVASLTGGALAEVLDTGTSYQVVQLTYQTGNSVPTNGIGISLSAVGTASVGGTFYVDNFQLTQNPIQIQFNPLVVKGNSMTISGSGGTTNSNYELITSTSLLTPQANWTLMSTNHFDTSGNFSQQIPIDTNTFSRFFRVVLPQN